MQSTTMQQSNTVMACKAPQHDLFLCGCDVHAQLPVSLLLLFKVGSLHQFSFTLQLDNLRDHSTSPEPLGVPVASATSASDIDDDHKH